VSSARTGTVVLENTQNAFNVRARTEDAIKFTPGETRCTGGGGRTIIIAGRKTPSSSPPPLIEKRV
jgi:hypothetical protein